MKIKFKVQDYQTEAVQAVVDCFEGQPFLSPFSYRIDSGKEQTLQQGQSGDLLSQAEKSGFRNQLIQLNDTELLSNIQRVQRKQNLFSSESLTDYQDAKGRKKPTSYKPGAALNLDIEMETGTGKTYCYIKTMFELNKHYGWSKFIVIVPSIAIREGVYSSFQDTAEHFAEHYHKKARFFIYDSSRLHEIESFSSNDGINVMIMNIQAFASSSQANRRIYDELDAFNSRKPIDVIKANNPILILDEPQRLEGKATLEALPRFNPLFILRYSATHNTKHNLIYRLDAIDAYNHKLVKKIEVRGIKTQGIAGTAAYLYLQNIDISKQAPVARLDMQVQSSNGQISRKIRRIEKGDNLFVLSGNLEAYRDRYVVTQIDAYNDTIEFENGLVLKAGDVHGDLTEQQLRRIQIRETIDAHLKKEQSLFKQGIKVLSLFFIDTVAKYRDYDQADAKGEYARIFEEEYNDAVARYFDELDLEENDAYRHYLHQQKAEQVHKGYFSIDKNKNLVDPRVARSTLTTDDASAYDLIMRDKKRLLSFAEPTRFIFSHSALREGWDNPNIFVLCMLKAADPEKITTRRQEVGRGLRISVNQQGARMDDPATVHDINVLTVVANESFSDFAKAMQKEMLENLAARPRKAETSFFNGKVVKASDGEEVTLNDIDAAMIVSYLKRSQYIDKDGFLTEQFHQDKKNDNLVPMDLDYVHIAPQLVDLISSLAIEASIPVIGDARARKTNPRNDANLAKKEFQALWSRINQKAIYRVDFDSVELIKSAVARINDQLFVRQLSYVVETGTQSEQMSYEGLQLGSEFQVKTDGAQRYTEEKAVISTVSYDLVGKVAEQAELTRYSAAQILSRIKSSKFGMYAQNPEHFISETSRLIKECKAATLIERLSYDLLNESYGLDIFTENQIGEDFTKASEKLTKHVYDYLVTDSKKEKEFADKLEQNQHIEVYAKLPNDFKIPTPVGDYNPDWAIAFTEGSVKHVYFVAETKGSLSSLELREIEQHKIDCARKFFAKLAENQPQQAIRYDVVATYDDLLDKVS